MWKRKLEAEAVEEVKFLWKRKHFDERDWKRKRTRKRIILSGAGSGSKKFRRWGSGSKPGSIKLQDEELEAEALKIWLFPHLWGKCTRVLGAFFDRVRSIFTFEYKYQASTWGSEYEYSKNGTRVLHHWLIVIISHFPYSSLMQPVESCCAANFYATF